ncbi:hypothetical protein IEU95_15965 [Hoyosella rhizosphaerae]|uniref:hypothetical protein n=1 Tax=Hoyosella rhizosphaerae TaxID=1755582 RepID=UPI0016646C59|nr:hypothetical protein [Hoyosella rhizosphaerae]MBN4928331.1 hypothetical protein [Hoyosella rhizosphaerae]
MHTRSSKRLSVVPITGLTVAGSFPTNFELDWSGSFNSHATASSTPKPGTPTISAGKFRRSIMFTRARRQSESIADDRQGKKAAVAAAFPNA